MPDAQVLLPHGDLPGLSFRNVDQGLGQGVNGHLSVAPLLMMDLNHDSHEKWLHRGSEIFFASTIWKDRHGQDETLILKRLEAKNI
jgi:hypothetical protein